MASLALGIIVKYPMPCEAGYEWCRGHEVVHTIIIGSVSTACCVFHAPHNEKKHPETNKRLTLEEFNSLVFNEIDKAKEAIMGVDLSGTIFPGQISFNRYDKDKPFFWISFSKAKFLGGVSFIDSAFSDEAYFNEAELSGESQFGYSKFNSVANFIGTKFSGDAIFMGARFHDSASFLKAEFLSTANFSMGQFGSETDFRSAIFSAEATFLNATFVRETDFNQATFISSANFSDAKFRGNVDFGSADFKRESYFYGTIFSSETYLGAKFRGESFFKSAKFNGKADFSQALIGEGAIFRGETFTESASATFEELMIENGLTFIDVRMRRLSFIGTDLRKCEFVSCQWDEVDGRNVLHDEVKLLEQEDAHYNFEGTILGRAKKIIFADILPFDKWRIGQVESIYRNMKFKYKDMHNEFEVSKWHASEKEMQRKRTGLTVPLISRNNIESIFCIFILNLCRLASGYGENPLKAGFVLIMLILLACLSLGLAGLSPVEGLGFDWANLRMDKALNTIVVTALTTVEFALFRKPTFLEASSIGTASIKIFFQILIPLQAALFAFALRNRFRR